jgi:acetylornithine deacetylase/succinyl-diaminopimelate desuccinylase family protein
MDTKKRCQHGKISNLLVSLVRAPSYIGLPRQEEAVVRELKDFLQACDISSEIKEIREGRPNLVATLKGSRTGPHLLFCGHTDTVPPNAGSSGDSFAALEKDERLYGRGTADMKGALAAMAGALVALKSSGELARGKVTFAAVIDEEMESLGVESLILSGFRSDGAIVGEPTNNRIAIGHKGLEWLSVEFEGRAAHGGTPQAGINAISAAAHFVHLVEEELPAAFRQRQDPVLGLPVINLGTISGGDQPSTVAARCVIKLDRRWVMTETIDQVFEDLETILQKVRKGRPGLKTNISRVPGGMATMIHGPIIIDPAHPLVQAAQQALGEADQAPVPLTIFPAWTDGSLLSREANIPTIIWGPGELDYAHSPEESIKLSDVTLAAELYAAAAVNFTKAS